MTNHWADIDNSSLIMVIGANPAENHPAAMAHVNAARYGGKAAKLIVVDPRKTRTAQQADLFVRIRPGTDIAFVNGLLNVIIGKVTATASSTFKTNFLAWHNGTAGVNPVTLASQASNGTVNTGRAFLNDVGTSVTLTSALLAAGTYDNGVDTPYATPFTASLGYPKYCDTRARVVTAAGITDYKRVKLVTGSNTFSNMLEFTDTILDADTVFSKLKDHVANYTLAEVADICGCTEAEITAVATELIANSRMLSVDFGQKATPWVDTYKATTILYAMGQTQHTNGSQNIRDLAVLQTIMGNMGRPGGGINAMRGIHNVQGSTDMAVLYDGIPGYSDNPGKLTFPTRQGYANYTNGLYGNRMDGPSGGMPKDPYSYPGSLGLQQLGFYNMTTQWFGQSSVLSRTNGDFDKLYGLWPQGDGVQHITAFREMAPSGSIHAAVVWGQNPAVTEPNQSAVRTGLRNLDLLVCVDVFENETAACDRKDTGVTYLLPACSYVEEAGSATNSGRWILWRDRAKAPKDNSKSDLELLMRFAKQLNEHNAFTHITTTWAGMTAPITGSAWEVLYGKHCGAWDGSAAGFEALSMTDPDRPEFIDPVTNPSGMVYGSEVVAESIFKEMCRPTNDVTNGFGGGGTLWIYAGLTTVGAWNATKAEVAGIPGTQPPLAAAVPAWTTVNRAKSRVSFTFPGECLTYPRYGYAWLHNRRVFYNSSEVGHDVGDVYVAPGYIARVMTLKNTNTNTLADWATSYRKFNTVKDTPSVAGGPHALGLPGNFPAHTEPIETPRRDLAATYGRNLSVAAATVKADTNVAMWSSTDPVYADDTTYGSAASPHNPGFWDKDAKDYPFVLTTIRCVEHFQGGPITRNNKWNVEAEPVPWIEINSVDARNYGIADGDWVNIETARSDSTTDQEARTVAQGWAKGFKARVGVGLQSNQRVGRGVVAIPWHWGEKGLSTGSRANDLCIDAFDANTAIPEYKACLCKIEKM